MGFLFVSMAVGFLLQMGKNEDLRLSERPLAQRIQSASDDFPVGSYSSSSTKSPRLDKAMVPHAT